MKITNYFQRVGDDHDSADKADETFEETTQLSPRSWILTGLLPVNIPIAELLTLRPEEPGRVVMMGRGISTPRFVAHYLRAYKYTGMMHPAQPLPTLLQPLLDWANSRAESWGGPPGWRFNQALVNFYMDGAHYIGAHSDDETQLVPDGIIFSASFGQERTFRIKPKHKHTAQQDVGGSPHDIPCPNGTFIVMGGNMQQEFTHEVPRVTGRKAASMEPRVNVTFRMFK